MVAIRGVNIKVTFQGWSMVMPRKGLTKIECENAKKLDDFCAWMILLMLVLGVVQTVFIMYVQKEQLGIMKRLAGEF